jgi:chitinase
MDTERIFNYRALSVARGEKQTLIGYDHDEYVMGSKADSRNWKDILEEYKAVRQSSNVLFKSFDKQQLDLIGKANGLPLSARAAGFITVGHEMHHLSIVKERYL